MDAGGKPMFHVEHPEPESADVPHGTSAPFFII